MKGYNAVQERQMKIKTLKAILEKAFREGVDVDIKKLQAVMAIDYGTAHKKTLEYLLILQQVMGFTIQEGIIKNGETRDRFQDNRGEREFEAAIQGVLPVANQDEPVIQSTVKEVCVNELEVQAEEADRESLRPVSQ